MKLIFAIINNDDSHSVSTALMQNGFHATKLASTGGFLMSGNTTFLLCADDSRVEDVISVIRDNSKKRKQFVPNAASFGGGEGGSISGNSFPAEVSVGGATIFVTNVERFDKV
jgi:uncharacterized protein YaaQ